MRLKHVTLFAKLPYIVDNTNRGATWMKRKHSAFLQRSLNSDQTFLREFFAWSTVFPNQIETFGQDMINPKRTTQARIKWTRGPGQSRDRDAPKRLE